MTAIEPPAHVNLPAPVRTSWNALAAALREPPAAGSSAFEARTVVARLSAAVESLVVYLGRLGMSLVLARRSEPLLRTAVHLCQSPHRLRLLGWWLSVARGCAAAVERLAPSAFGAELAAWHRANRVRLDRLLTWRNLAAHGLSGAAESRRAWDDLVACLPDLPVPPREDVTPVAPGAPGAAVVIGAATSWLRVGPTGEIEFGDTLADRNRFWTSTFGDLWDRHERERSGIFSFAGGSPDRGDTGAPTVHLRTARTHPIVTVVGPRRSGRSALLRSLPGSLGLLGRPVLRFECAEEGPAAAARPLLRWLLRGLRPGVEPPATRDGAELLGLVREAWTALPEPPLLAFDDIDRPLRAENPDAPAIRGVLAELARLGGAAAWPVAVLTSLPGLVLGLPQEVLGVAPPAAGGGPAACEPPALSDPDVRLNPIAAGAVRVLHESARALTAAEIAARLGVEAFRVRHVLGTVLAGWTVVGHGDQTTWGLAHGSGGAGP